MRLALLALVASVLGACGAAGKGGGDVGVGGDFGTGDATADLAEPRDLAVILDLRRDQAEAVYDLVALPDLQRPARRVFITHGSPTGDLGGKVGADATCQADATQHNLQGVYVAVLWYPNTPPSSYLQLGGKDVYNTAGVFVSRDEDFLGQAHTGPIDCTADAICAFKSPVWTGVAGDTCAGWTVADATLGNPGQSDRPDQWAGPQGAVAQMVCSGNARIYCVAQ